MAAYQQAKEGILRYQSPSDTAILNRDDPIVRTMTACGQGQPLFYSMTEQLDTGVCRQDDTVVYNVGRESTPLFHRDDLNLRGTHNLGNAAAAAAAAMQLGVPPDTMARGISQFRGLTHRLEWVATKRGVQYYNDSKATTPVSTLRAIEAFDQPLVLLAGGSDKGTPFDELAHVAIKRVKAAVVYGATAPKLMAALEQATPRPPPLAQPRILQVENLKAALQQAVKLAAPGDAVLLSPACASYDQFPHYEARGETFRALVQALPDTV